MELKKYFSVCLIISTFFLLSLQAFAHSRPSTRCHWQTNRWGDRVRKCRTVYTNHSHRHHHSSSDDAVVAGVAAGAVVAGAVILAERCAPEVVEGNLSATERTLNELASTKEFATQTKFNSEVARIAEISDTKVQLSEYFKLVDVESSEDVAYFVGARDDEFGKYAASLEKNTNLDASLSNKVISSLVTSLKGNLK